MCCSVPNRGVRTDPPNDVPIDETSSGAAPINNEPGVPSTVDIVAEAPSPCTSQSISVSTSSELSAVVASDTTAPPHLNDIGLVMGHIKDISDNDKYALLTQHWTPSYAHVFPSHVEHGKKRTFQRAWLSKYNGLVYSPGMNGAICIYCALFSHGTHDGVLVNKPYTTNYHKSSTVLGEHFHGKDGKGKGYHLSYVEAAQNFVSVMAGNQQPIDHQLDQAAQERVRQNRLKLKSIIKSVIFCGKQNIPFRGHRDDARYLDDTENNPGNFQKLLEFRVDAGDTVLRDHFNTAEKRTTYRSKTTQNELIEICGKFVRDSILNEIRESGYYSIAADEASDQANHEQMSIVLRFVRFVDATNTIRTEFMGFLKCESTTGEAIANLIVDNLRNWNIPLENCRGQTYDGAGNMSGGNRGVAARIMALNNKAIYTHCASHRLNLAIVRALKHPQARNMMDKADKIVRFYKYSPKRQHNLEQWIEELHREDEDGNNIKKTAGDV